MAMKRKDASRLAALISASVFMQDSSATSTKENNSIIENTPVSEPRVLNSSVPLLIAQHRSHSSHGSHGSHSSHRSSSGSAPAPSPRAAPAPRQVSPQSDPLGQSPRPQSSIPSSSSNANQAVDKETLTYLVTRVQLYLRMEDLFDGEVDGILGPQTRAAIDAYKESKNITSSGYLTAEVLSSMGIIVP